MPEELQGFVRPLPAGTSRFMDVFHTPLWPGSTTMVRPVRGLVAVAVGDADVRLGLVRAVAVVGGSDDGGADVGCCHTVGLGGDDDVEGTITGEAGPVGGGTDPQPPSRTASASPATSRRTRSA